MITLAIDYGTKKIGLAISNKDATIAFPHTVIQNDDFLWETLQNIIEQENIEKIIVGTPQYNITTPFFTELKTFIATIKAKVALPIETYDELLTSQAAKKQTKGNGDHDIAAMLILEGYLNKIKERKE